MCVGSLSRQLYYPTNLLTTKLSKPFNVSFSILLKTLTNLF